MPLHKDLTGADLHEPKGVESATSGTVYVANGSGSGSWSALSAANVLTPSSITSAGGNITIASNQTLMQVLQQIIDQIDPAASSESTVTV